MEPRGSGAGSLATCKLWGTLPADLGWNSGPGQNRDPWTLGPQLGMHAHPLAPQRRDPGNPAGGQVLELNHREQTVGDQGLSQSEFLASASEVWCASSSQGVSALTHWERAGPVVALGRVWEQSKVGSGPSPGSSRGSEEQWPVRFQMGVWSHFKPTSCCWSSGQLPFLVHISSR